MNGFDITLFYENYARYKLAELLKVDARLINHLTPTNPSHMFDLEFKGIKYDVKLSSPVLTSKTKKIAVWDFDLRGNSDVKGKNKKHTKLNGYCDFFILMGMKNGVVNKVFLVPSAMSPSTHIRISIKGKSKYHDYEI